MMKQTDLPPEHLQPVVSVAIPIRWGDMDALGHLNNTAYFRLMEEARVHLLQTLQAGDQNPSAISVVIVNTGCSFLRPVVYPETLKIACFVGQVGNSSFMTWYQLYALSDRSEPSTPVCTGYAKAVWIDRESGQSAPLPDLVRQRLSRFSQAAVS